MRKFLLLVLICLILLFVPVFSRTEGVSCFSSAPSSVSPTAYDLPLPEQGDSFIQLVNRTGGEITITSVDVINEALVIDDWPTEIISPSGEIELEMKFAPGVEEVYGEQFLINYVDQSGSQKYLIIICSGGLGYTPELVNWFVVMGLLSFPLFFIGIAFIAFGYLKKNRKIRITGFYLVPLAILFYILFFIFA